MAAVGGVVIAAAEGVARAKKGVEDVDDRLPTRFADEGTGSLRENAPTAVLQSAPK